MTRLTTIFSTGDAGAARGALEAALELGLQIAGWTAAPGMTYGDRLRTTLAPRMAARLNVQDSDGTLIVSFSTSLREGSPAAYADEAVGDQRKASLHIVLPDGGRSDTEDVRKEVLAFVAEEKIATLHVTGPREAEEPGIQQAVRDALVWIFEDEVGPRVSFSGVDRTAAPESLAGSKLAAPAPPGSVVDVIARIGADLPNRPERPPLTTEDALRQVAATGDDDARLQALAELAHRDGAQPTHVAINPANVDAAIAAGLDVEWTVPPGTPFTVDECHAPPTVRPWPVLPRGSMITPADLEPQHLPGERGYAYHNYLPPPVFTAVAVADRAYRAATAIVNRSYDMPPPGGWKVDGPVSPPVPDLIADLIAEHPGHNGIGRFVEPVPTLGQSWARDNWLWCGCAGPHGRCPNERCTNHKDAPWHP